MRPYSKLILVLALLLASSLLFAEKVPQQKAAETAAAFFSSSGASAARRSRTIQPAEDSGASGAFWVFNRSGGGFVVVAGNDAVKPILAYSLEGEFPTKEEMPDNMRGWFASLEAAIASIPADAVPDEDVSSQWANPARKGGVKTKALPETLQYETANWNQMAPYNNLCPTIGSSRCVTGCVATAASIIARYFQWPDAGEGTVASYAASNVTVPSHNLGYAYDWENMPLVYQKGVYTDAQATAVAKLMYDMGTIAKMNYGTLGSSASDGNLLKGIKAHMKYNKGAYVASRNAYDDDTWLTLVKTNLQNGPIMYAGMDPYYGGHEFVMDGYDENDMFHINWGWGGYCNCYCALSYIHPSDEPDVYSANQSMIVDLYPDYDGTSTVSDLLVFEKSGAQVGIKPSVTSFSKNVNFSCTVGWVKPLQCDFDGSVYISLYDKHGTFKQDISTSAYNAQIPVGSGLAFPKSCRITCDIAPGDRIKVRYVGQHNEGVIDIGAGCVTEVIVMEDTGGDEPDPGPDPTEGYTAAQTAASTGLAYNRASGTITLTCAHAVNWIVSNSVGTKIAEGKTDAAGSIPINMSGYAAGTYTISVGSLEDLFSFTITK